MIKNLVFIETSQINNFLSLIKLRTIYDLAYGTYTIIERIKKIFNDYHISYIIRDTHQELFKSKHPHEKVNLLPSDPYLVINPCLDFNSLDHNLLTYSEPDTAYFFNDIFLFAKNVSLSLDLKELTENKNLVEYFNNCGFKIKTLPDFKMFNYLWDFLDSNAEQIISDIKRMTGLKKTMDFSPNLINIIGNDLYIGENTNLQPFVFIDTTNGPVAIDENSKISSFSYLEGPLYIGKNVIIRPHSKILKNTSIFDNCKIAGEVSDIIMLPFSNKQHDGFVGNSYIGSWVNLGANTITSNLKINYGKINVNYEDYQYESGKTFLGSIIGDHTKTAINTSLNSGCVTGIFSNIFNFLCQEKNYSDFTWGNNNEIYDLQKAVKTAEIAMSRRNQAVSPEELDLFNYWFSKRVNNV